MIMAEESETINRLQMRQHPARSEKNKRDAPHPVRSWVPTCGFDGAAAD